MPDYQLMAERTFWHMGQSVQYYQNGKSAPRSTLAVVRVGIEVIDPDGSIMDNVDIAYFQISFSDRLKIGDEFVHGVDRYKIGRKLGRDNIKIWHEIERQK